MKYRIKAFFLALGLLVFSGIANSATLTAATGGSAIASNTAAGCSAAGTWTALTGPTITESGSGGGEIGLGTIVLSAPAGFVFNTASAVTILLTGNGTNTRNINNVSTGTLMATSITATAITFTVTSVSSRANTLTWQGIQVRPTASTPLATGNITETGTAATSGIASGANYGTLTEVTSIPVCNPSVPAVTTNAATGLTSSGAMLNGTVSSNGATTTVTFDYGLSTTYGSTATATASPLAAGATNTAVSVAITGLTCGGTTYHFRVKGVNSVGTSNGSDANFTTPACVVTLGKTVSTASAAVGSYVTFNLTATNANTIDLTNVTLTDSIPVGLTYVTNAATQGTATASGQVLTWNIPYLPAGGNAQLTLVVQPTARGTYTNTITSTGATSASATILILPSAITRYSMDEPVGTWNGTAGEVIDSGGNGLSGHRRTTSTPTTTNTVVPNPTIASQHSIVGDFCNAGQFDGNAVVESASSTFFYFQQTLSASAWIYPTGYPTGNNGQDLSSILSDDVNYEFHLDPNGHLYWWWQSSTLTSAAVIPLNRWTHIAITMDSSLGANSRERIYINGVADTNTNNWSGTLTQNTCPFYIGGDISTGSGCTLLPGRNFHGMIDEAKIYNYELSAAEVQADMTLGRQCGATSFNHIRIVHDGTASTCTPKVVTIKACMDSGCNSLYPGTVTAHLTPTGWSPSTNDTVTITGGVASVTLSNSSISVPTLTLGGTANGSVLPSNTTVRCFNGSTETCTLNVAATNCTFDAVETGANPQTHLYTKLAGTPFNVDVLALSNSTTINTTYTGTVTVDLVDTSTAACSSSSTVLSTTQPTITYTAANKGRYPVSLTCATAAPNAQVRIKVGASSYACSYDKLAVRPTAFNITSDATNSSATSTPAIKAGSAFNLYAASVAGYNGTPTIDNTKVAGTPIAGTLSGSFSAAPVATGTATGSFTYSEVGNFGLSQDAVYDSSFTAVDQSSDCVTTSTSNVLASGKYGCSIGSVAVPQTTGSSGFGRFIPDHFETAVNPVSGVPMTCPTGQTCPLLFNGFVYSGQMFTTQVTAKNAICPGPNFACGTTQNYAGSYARNVTLAAWDALGSTTKQNPLTGSLLSGMFTNNSIASSAFSSGIATTTSANSPNYALLAAILPTNIYIRATETSGDGVTSLRTTNPTTTSIEGGVMVVNGRIKASNAYGSELLPLTLMATAQYYSANGWINSTTDSVTKLALTYTGLATTQTLTPASKILNLGNLSIKFAAPGAAGTVTVTPSIDAASPGNPPLTIIPGTATFGVYKDNNGFIYRRENY